MQWSPNLCRICGDLRVCQSISTELKDKIKRYLNIQIGRYSNVFENKTSFCICSLWK